MKESAGRIIAVDQVDEGIGRAEGERFVGPGGLDEAGAAGAVDSTQSHSSSVHISGDFFRGDQDIAGWSSSDRRCFIDFARVVLRIDRGAAGEDGECRSENADQIAQRFAVNNAVGVGIASLFAAQAMDEHIGSVAAGQLGAEIVRTRRVGNKDAVRFVREAVGGFLRGNQRGDVPTGLVKKVRASLAGVATAGEEDARS